MLTAFSGSDASQADAKRLAEGLISDRGADVLFAAALPSGLGTIAAASQRRALAIGIDRDQYDVAPNAVLSSVVKRTDVAAARALEDFAQGRLTGGNQTLGVADGGVGLAPLTGRLVAELLTTGQTSFPLEKLTPERFAAARPAAAGGRVP